MKSLTSWRRLVQYVVIPLGGVALAFVLAFSKVEKPSLVVLSAAMMGYPVAALADRLASKQEKQDE